MYRINFCNKWIGSAEISAAVGGRFGAHPDAMRHIFAIEELESRGARYSNQDFDVLSAAIAFLDRGPKCPRTWRTGSFVMVAIGRGEYPYHCDAAGQFPRAMIYRDNARGAWEHEHGRLYNDRDQQFDNVD